VSIEINDRPDLRYDEEVEQDWLVNIANTDYLDDDDFDNNH